MSELDVLLLRLDAPLMSFGGVRVDERGVVDEAPGVSLVTGLVANALGYDHRDVDRLERLQDRLRIAVRRDEAGELLEDFQTVDLGQSFMRSTWTTWHRPAERGGASGQGTHIRRRQYWADAVFTVALTLDAPAEAPTLDDVARALDEPERPLFLGRKPCLPAARLVLGRVQAPSLKAAVCEAPRSPRPRRPGRRAEDVRVLAIWWPEGDAPAPAAEAGERQPVYDLREWANQVHTGRRFVYRSTLAIEEGESHGD